MSVTSTSKRGMPDWLVNRVRAYVIGAVVVLIGTLALKTTAILGVPPSHSDSDPVMFFRNNRQVLLLGASFGIIVAVVIVTRKILPYHALPAWVILVARRLIASRHGLMPLGLGMLIASLLGDVTEGATLQSHPPYEVRGRAAWYRPSPSGVVSTEPSRSMSFTVVVDDDRWWIKLVRDDAGEETNPGFGNGAYRAFVEDYQVACSDGTFSYEVKSTESVKRRIPDTKNAGEARRIPGQYPAHARVEMLAVWSTYASGSYLRSRTGPLVEFARGNLPLVPFGDRELQSARWSLMPEAPYLPEMLETSGDTNWIAASEAGMAAAFATNIAARVEATTNVNGLRLPSSATVTVYGPVPQADGSTRIRVRGVVALESINIVTKTSLTGRIPPVLPQPVLLTESRRTDDGSWRSVTVLTNRWLSAADVQALLNPRSHVPSRVRWPFVVLLCAVLALPVALIGYRRVANTN